MHMCLHVHVCVRIQSLPPVVLWKPRPKAHVCWTALDASRLVSRLAVESVTPKKQEWLVK